jgi:hypothetical protein
MHALAALRVHLQHLPAPRLAVASSASLRHIAGFAALMTLATTHSPSVHAQLAGWSAGGFIDVAAASRALELGQRDKGLGLGHSDLSAGGPLGAHLDARATVAAHTVDRRLEFDLEEAWLQTRTLPAGLQLRLGRFASQIGYQNERHPHADDFVERPLLYRAFLGGHWFDDGVRINWTAPTELFMRLGAEFFSGRQLIPEASTASTPGAAVLSAKLGGDWGRSQSWQLGAGYLNNRRQAVIDEHDADGEDEEEAGHHDHAHGARFSGERLWLVDFAWKWAPDGNNRQQQLRLAAEYARVTDPGPGAGSSDLHEAVTLSLVWRFLQQWEVGARADWLKVAMPHDGGFETGRLREQALMFAWKPSHAQTLRLQLTTQNGAEGFDAPARHAVQLQYVLGLGAHPAHAF